MDLKKPEIQVGSLVEPDALSVPLESLGMIFLWLGAHRWPMKVVRMCSGGRHIYVEDKGGKVVHFGSSPHAEVAIGFFKLHVPLLTAGSS